MKAAWWQVRSPVTSRLRQRPRSVTFLLTQCEGLQAPGGEASAQADPRHNKSSIPCLAGLPRKRRSHQGSTQSPARALSHHHHRWSLHTASDRLDLNNGGLPSALIPAAPLSAALKSFCPLSLSIAHRSCAKYRNQPGLILLSEPGSILLSAAETASSEKCTQRSIPSSH